MDTLFKKVVHFSILGSLCMCVLSAPAQGQNGEIYFIEAGTDPEFKRIYDHYRQFREEYAKWSEISEDSYQKSLH